MWNALNDWCASGEAWRIVVFFAAVLFSLVGRSIRINMRILERFNGEGIEFAFPSQTVYLAGSGRGEEAA